MFYAAIWKIPWHVNLYLLPTYPPPCCFQVVNQLDSSTMIFLTLEKNKIEEGFDVQNFRMRNHSNNDSLKDIDFNNT